MWRALCLLTLVACADPADDEQSTGAVSRVRAPEVDNEQSGLPSSEGDAAKQAWLDERARKMVVVSTVTTSLGQLVDCVDVNRQPALWNGRGWDPITLPEGQAPPRHGAPGEDASAARLASVDCPSGAVPMMHIDMDMLRPFPDVQSFQSGGNDTMNRPGSATARAGSTDELQFAGVKKTGMTGTVGAGAILNIWRTNNFYVSDDFTLTAIFLYGGSGSNYEEVTTGYVRYDDLFGEAMSGFENVNPCGGVYGCGYEHFFTYRAGNSTGCWNGTCDDFVQISSTYYPGQQFDPNHETWWCCGGVKSADHYEFQLDVQRWSASHVWAVYYDSTYVGYYPATYFDSSGIGTSAPSVAWSGEIRDTVYPGHTGMDMGSWGSVGAENQFPGAGIDKNAYIRNIGWYSPGWTEANIFVGSFAPYTFRTDAYCYDVTRHIDTSGDWGNYIWYGGPGLHAPNCN
jgi:hypothetical protein